MRLVDVIIAFPTFFLLLTLVGIFEVNIVALVLILGLTSWTSTARLVRGEILSLQERESVAHTPVLVYVDGAAEALIEVGDVVRPGSYRAVDRLRRLGVRPVLATGDREAPAEAVAKALGIEEAYARWEAASA